MVGRRAPTRPDDQSPRSSAAMNTSFCSSLAIDFLNFDLESTPAPHFSVGSLEMAISPHVQTFGGNVCALHPLASQFDAKTWTDRNMTEEECQLSFGPSRIPHNLYLHCAEALGGIQKEMRDLTEVTPDGIDPLTVMRRKDARMRGLPFIRATLIVRKKSAGIWKSRQCLRGDLVDVHTDSFTSSPTAQGASLDMFLSAARLMHFPL